MPTLLVYTDGEVIGDGMLRLIFAQALKQAEPTLRITWLSTEYSVYSGALKAMADPLIDELIILPVRKLRWDDLLKKHPLANRKFDIIIDTQFSLKRTLWLKRITHKLFLSRSADQWFSTRIPGAVPPHFLERLLQMGSFAVGRQLAANPLPLPPGDWQTEAARLLPDGPRYLGLVVGSTHPSKIWPAEKFIRLAEEMTGRGYTPVIFLGPNETTEHARWHAALPGALFPLNETHNASPYLTMALGARLAATVANDSGGAHLIAAGNKPMVTLFRSKTVRQKFTPITSRVLTLAPEDVGVATLPEIPYEPVRDALLKLV